MIKWNANKLQVVQLTLFYVMRDKFHSHCSAVLTFSFISFFVWFGFFCLFTVAVDARRCHARCCVGFCLSSIEMKWKKEIHKNKPIRLRQMEQFSYGNGRRFDRLRSVVEFVWINLHMKVNNCELLFGDFHFNCWQRQSFVDKKRLFIIIFLIFQRKNNWERVNWHVTILFKMSEVTKNVPRKRLSELKNPKLNERVSNLVQYFEKQFQCRPIFIANVPGRWVFRAIFVASRE